MKCLINVNEKYLMCQSRAMNFVATHREALCLLGLGLFVVMLGVGWSSDCMAGEGLKDITSAIDERGVAPVNTLTKKILPLLGIFVFAGGLLKANARNSPGGEQQHSIKSIGTMLVVGGCLICTYFLAGSAAETVGGTTDALNSLN